MSSSSDSPDDFRPQNLPKYTYVPGITPHPVSSVQGHAFGLPRPQAQGHLHVGLVLFDHGYYWEAHEFWEAEWLSAGGSGPTADFIKAFIKLAACGVKCLEGNRQGAIRHARRAHELFIGSVDVVPLPAAVQEELTTQLTQWMTDPPIATAEQQQLARKGGVPLLGRLPKNFRSESFRWK